MALTDKDIVITPNRGQSADPKVEFKGASSTLGPQTISLNVYPTSNGTLSFEGSAGQLFSITNTLTGTIYSVNDVSGIPSIEVLDTGLVKLAQYSGNVVVGTATDDGSKLQVRGSLRVGNGGWNSSPAGTTFSHTIAANTGNFRTVNFDGNGNAPSVWWTSGSRPYGAIDAQDPGLTFWAHNGSGWQKQITMNYGTVNIDTALQQGGNQVLHAGNYNSYALPLSGGTVSGYTTFSADVNMTSGNSYLPGHFYTNTWDGSNVYFHVGGSGSTTNKTLNLRVMNSSGGNSLYEFDVNRLNAPNLQINGNQVLHAGNYNSYAPTLTGGSASGTWPISVTGTSAGLALSGGFTIDTPGSGYARFNNWVNLSGAHGFYSSVNNAHIYPNNGSYGAWRVDGSRNSWNGIEFATNTGNVSLMIDVGGNTSGFHNNSYGWQMRWYNGTGYINKNAYGAGTEATILDSSNYTNYTNGIFLRAAGANDGMNFDTTQYNTMYYAYIQNSANKPPGYNYSYGTIITFDPGIGTGGRAQFYVSHAGNDLIFRGGWNANSSWTTWNRVLTDQNYTTWAPSLTGSGASGTWAISITGSAASAGSSPWPSLTGSYREDYNIGFRPAAASESYAGFKFGTVGGDANAGYLLIRNGSDNDVYTQNGITLVADAGWLTLAQRSLTDKGVRIMSGATSTERVKVTSAGDIQFVNGNSINYNTGRMIYGDNYAGNEVYNTGSIGRGGINVNQIFERRSGFIDVWASGGTNTSGSTHDTGFQSMHYWDGATGYGVQIAGNHGVRDTLKFRWRSDNGINPWYNILNSANYNSYSPTLTGGGASGTWGINITGSAGSVPASGITGQVGMWTSAQRPGPYRLYRRDDNSDYSVQTYWTGARWRLYGYNGDTGHADTHVGYADSAGSTSGNAATADKVNSTSGYTHPGTGMYPFFNWGGANGGANEPSSSSYTIGISVGSHPSDQAYGFQIARNMWNTGLWTRGYDSGFGGWVRLLDSSNYNSYSPTLTGGNASGTWPINITGTATDPSKVPISGGTMTGTLFINSKLRVNTASGPSDNLYGGATAPLYVSGADRANTTILVENTSNSTLEYPTFVLRRTATPTSSRFGSLIRFAEKNSSGADISASIFSFNRLTYTDLYIDGGYEAGSRVILRASNNPNGANITVGNKYVYYGTGSQVYWAVPLQSFQTTLDLSEGTYFTITISSDSTFAFTYPTNVANEVTPAGFGYIVSYSFTLEVTHTGGTITWPASVKWPGNVLPSLTTGKTHLFMFVTDDGGSRWRGSFLSNYDN